jgi:hypothetical protein
MLQARNVGNQLQSSRHLDAFIDDKTSAVYLDLYDIPQIFAAETRLPPQKKWMLAVLLSLAILQLGDIFCLSVLRT